VTNIRTQGVKRKKQGEKKREHSFRSGKTEGKIVGEGRRKRKEHSNTGLWGARRVEPGTAGGNGWWGCAEPLLGGLVQEEIKGRDYLRESKRSTVRGNRRTISRREKKRNRRKSRKKKRKKKEGELPRGRDSKRGVWGQGKAPPGIPVKILTEKGMKGKDIGRIPVLEMY